MDQNSGVWRRPLYKSEVEEMTKVEVCQVHVQRRNGAWMGHGVSIRSSRDLGPDDGAGLTACGLFTSVEVRALVVEAIVEIVEIGRTNQ